MNRIYQKISTHEIIKLISYPPYLYFSLAVLFSQLAINMATIVLIFIVFFLTSSNFSVSLLLIVILAPQIFVSFLGGIVADLKNKKLILVYGNLFRALLLLLLFLNSNNLLLIYFVVGVLSTITQFYVPAEAPLIPLLVRRESLLAANSIFGISLFGSILVGYVLAGPAVNFFGRSGVFLILSCVFFVATFFAAFIPKNLVKASSKESAKKNYLGEVAWSIKKRLVESCQLLKDTSEVGSAFFLLISSQVIILILATLVPGYAKTILEVPVEDLSLLLFAPAAVGMIISALLIGGLFKNIDRKALMNYGILISGLTLILFPLASRFVFQDILGFANHFLPSLLHISTLHFAILLAFTSGFANALIFVPSQAIIQEEIPAAFGSKIYGLLFSLVGALSVVPIILAGTIADTIGVGTVLVAVGITIILIGISRSIQLMFYRSARM